MSINRVLIVALAVSSAAASQASYELLLAVDNTTSQIHRFDSVSGLSLGSFGAGNMYLPSKIAVDPTQGIAYVSSYTLGSIQKWNYSTGAYLGELTNSAAFGWGLVRLNNGNIAVAAGSQVKTFSPAGALLSTLTTGGFGLGTDGVNLFVGSGGQIQKFSPGGALLGTLLTPGRDNLEINVQGTTAFSAGALYGNRFGRFNPATMTGFTEFGVTNLLGSLDIEATAMSHGAVMYVAGRSPNAGNPVVFSRYNIVSNITLPNTFGSLQSSSRITGMAIVLAPEPGTMAILGLGLIAVMRKRRGSVAA